MTLEIEKKRVVDEIIAKLETELAHIEKAALAAREAATHEESKPEDSHDTRGLEASYLAGAQMARATELKNIIASYKFMPLRNFTEDDHIDAGALVELDYNQKKSFYFLVPQGGGVTVQVDQKNIQVITPKSPLGDALLGRWVGDIIEVEGQNITREYEITQIG